jgi:4-diphosphocytidyl-2-C-methyl-D-erythritol kinase
MAARRVLRARARAKVNLSLRVLGVRADGYHELRTVFQSIALHDTLTFRPARGPLRLDCSDPACPVDRTNLVWRAAACVWAARGRAGEPRDLAIRIEKRIPMQAGLGGGSSDAASALRVLASMWKVDAAQLPDMAASLGADVPYFLEGGTVLGLERGDLLFPLLDIPGSWVTLVMPGFGVSTKDAFGWWDEDAAEKGDAPLRCPVLDTRAHHRARPSARGGGAPRVLSNVGADGMSWLPECDRRNDLQIPVAKRHPETAAIVSALRRGGAWHAAMSGSGSAVFGLFDRKADAERAARLVGRDAQTALVSRTVDRAEYRRQ